MSLSCLKTIDELSQQVDIVNDKLIDNMTNQNTRPEYVCVKPNVTYDYFYQQLKLHWNITINNFINQPSKCNNIVGNLLEFYRYATPEKINRIKEFFQKIEKTSDNTFENINLENIIFDIAAEKLMQPNNEIEFNLDTNFITSISNLGKIFASQCPCQLVDIYKFLINKYGKKYQKKLNGKNKQQVVEILKQDYQKFKQSIYNLGNYDEIRKPLYENMVEKMTNMYSFSVGDELEKLIPNELGSLKQFFIQIISTYYDNLHPIIWAQIFKGVVDNIFIDLPYSSQELFSFFSKQLLLNSGPFILKMLQMIRPVLSPELAKKYNLTKLTYPLLKPYQIDMMLSKVVYQWDMYRILENFSASVGHVTKLVNVAYPNNPFMIKLIKPLAVAQSCWEFKTLYQIFPVGSCEEEFVKNMLEAIGHELNVQNEIKNIKDGHKYYTASYGDVFPVNVDAHITTVQHIDGILVPNSWYALAMTIAPGIPLSKLIESDEIQNDTKYRAKLHRCLDLLVYKFFQNIVKNGFYHGDLHSGNIFYSYQESQLTLIDFGAVGNIDIYTNNKETKALLDVIVMSIFYNYDDLFDNITNLLNEKCKETQIDMNSSEYRKLKMELYEYRINNIIHEKQDSELANIYKNDIFSKKRIDQEQKGGQSIYYYLEHLPVGPETVLENRDVLPNFTHNEKSPNISFPQILEKIIKYYALSGVNIAIKFSEFYEFQKAYALLLGVLHKVNYNSYRTGIAIGRAIKNWNNLPKILEIETVSHVVKTYWHEHKQYKKIKKQLNLK